jgi:hypothetical protein
MTPLSERVRRIIEEFRLLSLDEQLAVLRRIGDGEDSGLTLRVQMEAVDLARQMALDELASARASRQSLNDRLSKRDRKPSVEAVRLAREIDVLKSSLSWSQVVDALWQDHRDWFPDLPDGPLSTEDKERLVQQCRQAHRRLILQRKPSRKKRS